MEKHKYYTDQERYEHCRRCRISGKTVTEYARENGINRATLRDWMNAYKNIHGKFINVNIPFYVGNLSWARKLYLWKNLIRRYNRW